ncbi:MAG: tRNA (adenosine(37)-N6)-threonylcarbamoyltransferase complex transferase subunit TsaD [Phycisphaeraceae bacterium]|nr:tRNA (adenosine(37)-N6)-threonylcarbamoyltransferase complex transferase subunit TsaD [Phycisphaeraceae bacterium]
MSLVLGIESSCDETAAAVVADGWSVRSNVIASQHELHRKYDGVVPEIASRAHIERILPVVDEALREGGATLDDVEAVAVGHRPGLIGSLLVGVSAAKALAWAAGKPFVGIDHIQAHLHAAGMVKAADDADRPRIEFPCVGLVVSGGHTSLFDVDGPMSIRLIGKTIDDAVGEAYDKAAVILGAGYPGGPAVDRLAAQGDAAAHDLPKSTLGSSSLDFSFSGLKTALLYTVRGRPQGRGRGARFERSADDLTDAARADLAASFQAAAIGVLVLKLERALDALAAGGRAPRGVIIGGGVSANALLRAEAIELSDRRGVPVHVPPMPFCLDNAAMIAGLADVHLGARGGDGWDLPALATGER